MRNRGLLTQEDRRVVKGEKSVGDERISDIKWNIQQRMDRIETDLEVLREAGGDWAALADDFAARFGRDQELLRRIKRLEDQLKEE